MPIVPLSAIPADAVEQLLDRAFGPERHTRTAYRIRDEMPALAPLSFASVDGEAVTGTIQCWPIALQGDDGRTVPLIMLGPVAVDPLRQQAGIGRALMAQALEAADTHAPGVAVVLIGDPEYYGRFFDFSAEHTVGWRVPGPVERHRLLARGSDIPTGSGLLGPRPPVRT